MKKSWSWKNVELQPELATKLQQNFELSLYQKAVEHDPENVDVLVYLGDAFSKRGMIQAGLEIDLRLVRICPEEPTFYYNLACSHSLLGQVDPAFGALDKAIRLGYQNFEYLLRDNDLENLRKDSRFAGLLPTNYYQYYLACNYSLTGQIEPAFRALEKAIELGYQNVDQLKKDSALENLRKDSRFEKLLKTFAR